MTLVGRLGAMETKEGKNGRQYLKYAIATTDRRAPPREGGECLFLSVPKTSEREAENLEQPAGQGDWCLATRFGRRLAGLQAHGTDDATSTEAPEEPTTSWHTVFAHGDAVERLQNVQIGCADVPPFFLPETPC